MAELFDRIRDAVAQGRYVIGNHADNRLRERRIASWQIEAGLSTARLVESRPNDRPNPAVVVDQQLADGTSVRVVWSYLPYNERAKLVTVHFVDR